MQCVILAGGLGTRMWPEAASVPKTLLTVAEKPFAHWQLSWLSNAGIDSVVYSIGYLGEQVREYVGDGEDWDLAVRYVIEPAELLGTAGALRLAYDWGALESDFLVLYGDSWLQVDPAAVLETFRTRAEPALMTVFKNAGQWDGSNVVFDGNRVQRYEKGLSEPPAEMCWIDYGLLAMRAELLAERVLPATKTDLAPLCTQLAAEGLLAGIAVTERFYEIGSPTGRAEVDALLGSAQQRPGS